MRIGIAVAALAVALVGLAAASPRRACLRACRPLLRPYCEVRGGSFRLCRKAILRDCRVLGVEAACGTAATTTTVTTSSSTTAVSATTTTTSMATTTTVFVQKGFGFQILASGRYSYDPTNHSFCHRAMLVLFLRVHLESAGGRGVSWALSDGTTCPSDDVLVPPTPAIVDDFFDFVFPVLTDDPGAIRNCATIEFPRSGDVDCMLFVARREQIPGPSRIIRLEATGPECVDHVEFTQGCLDGRSNPRSCLPLLTFHSPCVE